MFFVWYPKKGSIIIITTYYYPFGQKNQMKSIKIRRVCLVVGLSAVVVGALGADLSAAAARASESRSEIHQPPGRIYGCHPVNTCI
jgi:hypothetical protein